MIHLIFAATAATAATASPLACAPGASQGKVAGEAGRRGTSRLGLLLLTLMGTALISGCHFGRQNQPPPPVARKTMDDYNRPLAPGESALTEADITSLPDIALDDGERDRLLRAISHSLAWLAMPSAAHHYPVSGVNQQDVQASLQALADLLHQERDPAAFNRELKQRFRVLRSVGCDHAGTVLFTGYYTPIFSASLTPDGAYRYPVYRAPADLVKPTSLDAPAQQRLTDGSLRPYPARSELLASGALKGLELVYFRDPYEAYVVEVQGSARLTLTNGESLEIGYSATNNLAYHSIAQDLVQEGKIRSQDLSLATVRAYFASHPDQVTDYTNRNPRMVFFSRTSGGPFGSLHQQVTADTTIATDHSIFPPGAPCLVASAIAADPMHPGSTLALRMDQDTGGAIRAAGRCDLYMGIGPAAENRAGNQFAEGGLYYLLLRH